MLSYTINVLRTQCHGASPDFSMDSRFRSSVAISINCHILPYTVISIKVGDTMAQQIQLISEKPISIVEHCLSLSYSDSNLASAKTPDKQQSLKYLNFCHSPGRSVWSSSLLPHLA